MCKLRDVFEQASSIQTYLRRESGGRAHAAGGHRDLGAKSSTAMRFFVTFLEKKAILMPFDLISYMFRAI